MRKEPEEGLKKHRDIVDKYVEERGLTVDIGLDGNFELKKQFSEENIAEVVGIRLPEEGLLTINIYDKRLIDSVNTEIAQPIIKSGDDVILINRDIEDKTISGLIIFDTREKAE